MASSLESRLRAIELQVVFQSSNNPLAASPRTTTTSSPDVMARLQTLERSLQLPTQTQQLWNEIETMEQDLSPGTALTHQKHIMAPMLYRRQQILAEQDTFRDNLEQLDQILNLLLINQDNKNKVLTEEQVVNAPIVVGTALTADELEKVDRLAEQVLDLQQRVQHAVQRLDQILENYAGLVSAASEKLVLMEEDVRMFEKAKAT